MTDWTLSAQIEHNIRRIIAEQETAGWQFDTEKANQHLEFLHEEKEKLYRQIRPLLSLEVSKIGTTVNKPFRKDGSLAAITNRWFPDVRPDLIGGPFSRVTFTEPDLASRNKLKAQLLKLGWEPDEYTEKGNPRLTESSLTGLKDGAGRGIALWYIYSHREALIRSQLLPYVRGDGRIPAGANPCGTNTGRMTHFVVVNIPKAADHVVFGRQIRELFTTREGYLLVGHDAKGLELRFLAHYINDPDYTEVVIHGDPHTHHQNLAGLTGRDDAKTFIYAFIYGAGDGKLGTIAGAGPKQGKVLRGRFERGIPGLSSLIEETQREAASGYLEGLDGRRVWMRRDPRGDVMLHKALNTRIQSAGAIFMKTVTCALDQSVKREGLDVTKVGDFHDEGQAEVLPDHVERYTELIHDSFVKACTLLKVKAPMEAEVKVGTNWSETH